MDLPDIFPLRSYFSVKRKRNYHASRRAINFGEDLTQQLDFSLMDLRTPVVLLMPSVFPITDTTSSTIDVTDTSGWETLTD